MHSCTLCPISSINSNVSIFISYTLLLNLLTVDVDSDKGIFAVVVKKDETIGNVNISVSLSVVKGMEELVRLSNSINVTMVIIPPVEVPTSVTPGKNRVCFKHTPFSEI